MQEKSGIMNCHSKNIKNKTFYGNKKNYYRRFCF